MHIFQWRAPLLLFAALSSAAGADSLYRPGSYQALTSDLRARRVGDLITVMVYESASASSTANTTPHKANASTQLVRRMR